jgi:hypothetical protein
MQGVNNSNLSLYKNPSKLSSSLSGVDHAKETFDCQSG